MFSVWKWRLIAFSRKLWVRASLFALLGVITALVAAAVQALLPHTMGEGFGADAVEPILTVLASSMLAVTTFALGIMVSALSGAAQTATPRAVQLLMQDGTTQNVLATFLGAFLFSLVGIIALKAGIYGAGGRLVLFVASLVVVAVIVLTMLRWIAHLANFGRMRDVLARMERAASGALRARMEAPYLGGHPLRTAPETGARAVTSDRVGYVQHLDAGALDAAAEAAGLRALVAALPGAFVGPATPLCHLAGERAALAAADPADFARAFSIGPVREFDQDPRFGLQVLAEVASRALSPAVNDPGTAIDVIGRAVRLLAPSGSRRELVLRHPHIWVPEIRMQDLFEDVFRPIARDGAALVEVQMRLQKALADLSRINPAAFGRAAAQASAEALARAEAALSIEADKQILRELAANVAGRQDVARPPGI